jgi:hypothetical protein
LPVQAQPSQQYGQAAAQQRAQQQVPMARPPAQPPAAAGPQEQGPVPGQVGALDAPTARPGEAITAGAPFGAGPGPGVLPQSGDPVVLRLRAIYNVMPNEALRELLEDLEDEF